MDLSVIIPCYCSKATLSDVIEEIKGAAIQIARGGDYEIILVNDCSPDNGATDTVIRELCEGDRHIRGITLAKNSGQAAATMAGLAEARGELVAVGDDDGQTQFCMLPEMTQKLYEKEYDIICANYINRGRRSWFRRFGSWMASKMTYYALDISKDIVISSFFLAKRFVIEEMVHYRNPYPFLAGLITQITHNIGNLNIPQRERAAGRSGYNFQKLMSLWLNGLTAFSIRPLRLSAILGAVCTVVSFLLGIITIIRKLMNPSILAGYTTLLCTMLFLFGIILLVLGMIGEYIGRIYICLNAKPQYVIRDIIENTKYEEV